MEMFPDVSELDNGQSVRLMRALPVGVSQSGPYVTGPYGCLTSNAFRQLSPSLRFPGYQCADATCHKVHPIRLTTASSAHVNRVIVRVSRFLRENYPGDNPTVRPVSIAMLENSGPFEMGGGAPIDAIADSFTMEELAQVVDSCLRARFKRDRGQSEFSRSVGCVVANPSEFAHGLARSELLQILLLHTDREISDAVDDVLRSGRLVILDYEVRTERIKRHSYPWTAEVGRLGVRVRGSDHSRVADRMLDLLRRLYLDDGPATREDLQFLAEVTNAESDRALLHRVVHSLDPHSIIDQLVLATRATALSAADYLWIDPGSPSKEELRERLLWRLGMPGSIAFNELDNVELFAGSIRRSVESGADESSLRGHIANLFAALEETFHRGLSFAIWALTCDHLTSSDGFRYDPSVGSSQFAFLDEHSPTRSPEYALRDDGKNTLAPLAAGFARLASALKDLSTEGRLRPIDHFPYSATVLGRPFAFAHTVPFLDLEPNSQASLLRSLSVIASNGQSQSVLDLRNTTLHGNNEFPNRESIFDAIDKIAVVSRELRTIGLFPTVYELQRKSMDNFGREVLHYSSVDLRIELSYPTWVVSRRMPVERSRLIIVRGATLSGIGPLRFELKPNPRPDDYWDGWPHRRSKRVLEADGGGATYDAEIEKESLAG
jgi:hypothetical protein